MLTAVVPDPQTILAEDGPVGRQPPLTALAVVAVLRQLADVVRTLSDEQYRRKPVGLVSGSVGGHVRHSLDHVAALLAGVDTGEVDYDNRRRGTDVETSGEAALGCITRLQRQLLALPADAVSCSLRLTALVSSGAPPTEADTTLGRELIFLVSHLVHHNALIAVMALTLGVALPEHFGYAPSTIAHLERSACAR